MVLFLNTVMFCKRSMISQFSVKVHENTPYGPPQQGATGHGKRQDPLQGLKQLRTRAVVLAQILQSLPGQCSFVNSFATGSNGLKLSSLSMLFQRIPFSFSFQREKTVVWVNQVKSWRLSCSKSLSTNMRHLFTCSM